MVIFMRALSGACDFLKDVKILLFVRLLPLSKARDFAFLCTFRFIYFMYNCNRMIAYEEEI